MALLLMVQTSFFGMDNFMGLGELWQHAQEHRQEYGDSLLVFLSKHYGNLKTDHENSGESGKHPHEKLPFSHNLCSLQLVNQVSWPMEIPAPGSEAGIEENRNFSYTNIHSYQLSFDLFQPPRSV